MYALFKKEISNFLNSLIGIMVIVIFLLITGLFLWVFQSDFNIMTFGYANLDSLFILAPWVFLFLVPAVTMRSFAEEKRTGTIEMLFTKPLSDWQIVLGKYFAGVALVLLALIPTLIYYFSVYRLSLPVGNVDSGGIWGSYIGLFFLSSAFVSIGLFSSSLTNNQILAFLLSVFLCGFIYIGFDMIYSMALFGPVDLFIQQLGRGLRKAEGKEYVVVLDFIGNYNNNFMIPIALSGDRTYNPDTIRKYVISGNSTIPGASTVHFDEIAKDKIFASIDRIKGMKSIIRESYISLKNRLGRVPYLLDFYENAFFFISYPFYL